MAIAGLHWVLEGARRMRGAFQEATDPATGDHLSAGEHISWVVQGVIRRWAFLITITLLTAVVWLTNNSLALVWWNLCASYLALVIESIVGIAMFSQTRRDAVVLREIRALAQRIERQEEALIAAGDAKAAQPAQQTNKETE